jgi:hypothetical protein
MTIDQAKLEFTTMQVIVKKLIGLTDEQRKRVINFLLAMVTGDESTSAKEEMKVLSFCISRLEKLGPDESNAIVKFLIDRFYAHRYESNDEQEKEQSKKADEWKLDDE